MVGLKKENLNNCFTLLQEFVDRSGAETGRKGGAVLALKQLRMIIAGADSDAPDPSCEYKPRAGSPIADSESIGGD